MRLVKNCVAGLFIIPVFVLGAFPVHAATELRGSCLRSPDSAPAEIHCDIRATDPVEITAVTATGANGKRLDSRFEPFNHKLRSSAWLFLIQRTSHPKDSAREVERLLRFEGKRSYGVMSFAEQISELAALGSSETTVRTGLADIGARSGGTTALYTSAYAALLKLSAYTSERRALVIVADGRSDRDSQDDKTVIEFARQRNIVIHTIAVTDRDANQSQPLQALRRMATETGGQFIDAGVERKLTPENISRFHDFMENGGLVKAAASELANDDDLTLTSTIAGGATVSAGKGAIKWGPLSPVRPVPAPTFMEQITETSKGNPAMLIAVGLILAGLIGVGLAAAFRRPVPPPVIGGANEPSDEDTRTQRSGGAIVDTIILPGANHRPPETVYARLQFLDANSTVMPIGSTTVSIGRHEDNDICLSNPSVHRQHAVIHMTPERGFVLRDLGGQNGVIVNNKRIQQRELADGDLVEFGEVRARFIRG